MQISLRMIHPRMIHRLSFLLIVVCPVTLLAQGAWFCTDSTYCETGVNFQSMSRGVELIYENLPEMHLRLRSNDPAIPDAYGEIRNNRRIRFKAKLPVLNKAGFKVLLGLNYDHETFAFKEYNPEIGQLFENLQQKNLKNIGLDLYTLKPFRGKTYLAVAGGVRFSGDFEGFLKADQRYFSYSAAALFGIRKNPNVEVAFGAAFSQNLGYNSVIPLIKYDHTFTDKLGLETMLPAKVLLRYNFDPKTTFRAGIRIKGTSYQIGVDNLGTSGISALNFNRSYVQYGIEVDRILFDPIYFTASIGYMQNVNFTFAEPGAARRDYLIESGGGGNLYFKVGVFMTTPKRWRN